MVRINKIKANKAHCRAITDVQLEWKCTRAVCSKQLSGLGPKREQDQSCIAEWKHEGTYLIQVPEAGCGRQAVDGTPPAAGCSLLNVDAVLRNPFEDAARGGVARDHTGRILFAAALSPGRCSDAGAWEGPALSGLKL